MTRADLQSAIADAHASSTPLRVVGSGTWLSAGRPVHAAQQLSTRELAGIVEYVPGDLVITAHAGTTLQEIVHEAAKHGQWLALDPYGTADNVDSGTIGATIATASHGPLALGYGRARDLILGLSFITGDGTLVRAGGRVVKNVAGFDLVRLATGAWGTLGVISEVSLRLHARPAVDETFAMAVHLPESPHEREVALSHLVQRLNSAPMYATTSSLAALVLCMHDAPAALRAHHAVPASHALLLARATGNRTRVDAQRAVLAGLGTIADVDPTIWRDVRALERGNTALRVADAPLRSGATLRHIDEWLTAHHATLVRSSLEPLRGLVRVSCELPNMNGNWPSLPNRAIAERLPPGAWHSVPSAVNDQISVRLREQFDPAGILNPGLLGETADSMSVST